jgi:hypothetical protein
MDNTIDAKEEDYLYIHKSQIENSGNKEEEILNTL